MGLAIAWTVLTAVGVAATLAFEHLGPRSGLHVAKPLASLGFLGVAVAQGALATVYGQLVLAALVLCFFGDVLLLGDRTPAFRAGLFTFLLGHLAFAAAFLLLGQKLSWLWAGAFLTTVAGAVVGRWLAAHVEGGLRGPVIAYIVVIGAMVALSLGAAGATGRYGIPLAALAFYGSDLSVARDRFLGAGFGNRAWGLPLYYAAQLGFAWEIGYGS